MGVGCSHSALPGGTITGATPQAWDSAFQVYVPSVDTRGAPGGLRKVGPPHVTGQRVTAAAPRMGGWATEGWAVRPGRPPAPPRPLPAAAGRGGRGQGVCRPVASAVRAAPACACAQGTRGGGGQGRLPGVGTERGAGRGKGGLTVGDGGAGGLTSPSPLRAGARSVPPRVGAQETVPRRAGRKEPPPPAPAAAAV